MTTEPADEMTIDEIHEHVARLERETKERQRASRDVNRLATVFRHLDHARKGIDRLVLAGMITPVEAIAIEHFLDAAEYGLRTGPRAVGVFSGTAPGWARGGYRGVWKRTTGY